VYFFSRPYVETYFLEDEHKYKKEFLPLKIKEFILYSDRIKKNDVNIFFEGIK
jgi:hypothetical protein